MFLFISEQYMAGTFFRVSLRKKSQEKEGAKINMNFLSYVVDDGWGKGVNASSQSEAT